MTSVVAEIGWWNTSLSPPRGQKAKPKAPKPSRLTLAREVIRSLLVDEMSMAVLALGEVTDSDVKSLLDGTGQPERYGRIIDARRHVAIVYDTKRVTAGDRDNVVAFPLGEAFHACLWTNLEILGTPFVIAAAHWASRKLPQGDESRWECGRALQGWFRQAQKDAQHIPLLFIGDFNDEPFDLSLTKHLRGTRDRNAVGRDGDLLYNPFWKLLGENQALGETRISPCAGSHFWTAYPTTDWYTFDQALVSPSLLRGVGWTLVEERTRIVSLECLRTAKRRFRLKFDHLPIALDFAYRFPGTAAAGQETTNE